MPQQPQAISPKPAIMRASLAVKASSLQIYTFLIVFYRAGIDTVSPKGLGGTGARVVRGAASGPGGGAGQWEARPEVDERKGRGSYVLCG